MGIGSSSEAGKQEGGDCQHGYEDDGVTCKSAPLVGGRRRRRRKSRKRKSRNKRKKSRSKRRKRKRSRRRR